MNDIDLTANHAVVNWCPGSLTEPHPDFPDEPGFKVRVTHTCGEESGHEGRHYCRKPECLRSWDGDESHVDGAEGA